MLSHCGKFVDDRRLGARELEIGGKWEEGRRVRLCDRNDALKVVDAVVGGADRAASDSSETVVSIAGGAFLNGRCGGESRDGEL